MFHRLYQVSGAKRAVTANDIQFYVFCQTLRNPSHNHLWTGVFPLSQPLICPTEIEVGVLCTATLE